MGKNKLSSGLINVVTYDTENNISLNSGSNLLMSLSGSGKVTIPGNLVVLGGISGSSAESSSYALNADKIDNLDSTQLVLTSSFNSYTSSASSSLGSLSGSVATTTLNLSSSVSSSIGSLSGSIATTTSELSSSIGSLSSSVATTTSNLSSSVATTTSGLGGRITTIEGNYATTGSNIFVGSQVITGSLYITNDMVVQGCSCLQNITASAVSIGTNTVVLNTATPAVRFAGISVQDSGSNAGVTGSIFWDGLCNRWIYSNPSTVGYTGGMLLSGPRNTTGTIGNESTLTCNYLAKSGGGDHLYDSCIQEVSGSVTIGGTLCSSGVMCAPTVITTNVNVNTSTSTGANLIVKGYSDFWNTTNTLLRIQHNGCASTIQSYTGGATGIISLNPDGGNVGIGCSSLNYHLEVRCAASTSSCYLAAMFARSTGAADGIGDIIAFGANGVSSIAGMYRSGGGSWGLELQTANQNTRMRIDNSGISCFSCQVCVPNILISNCATIGTVGFSYPEFRLAVTPIMTVVGAGCASTGEGIYFKRSSDLCQGGWISGNGGALYIVGQNKHSTAFGDIYFATNNGTTTCDIMVISGANQRVGIGTTSPNTKLEVKGSIRLDSRSKVDTGEIDSITFTKDRPDASTGTYEMGSIRSFTYGGYAGGLTFYSGRHTGNGNYGLIPIMTIGSTSDIGTTNMGIGTTSPNSKLEVQKTGAQAAGIFINQCSSDEATIRFKSTHSCLSDFRVGASILVGSAFEIYNVQCNRTNYMVNCLGFSKISNDGTHVNGNNTNYHSITSTGDVILYAYQTGPGSGILSNVQACNNSIYSFRGYSDPYGDMAFIYSNGTFGSRTGTYGGIVSDARCKTEICDASSQWNDIKNLRVRNFKLIEDVENDPINAMRQIGFIAQEVEMVSPGLVFESGNGCVDSGCWKNVKTSIIHTKAIKALQEAMCRIEMQEETINILKSCLGI
jgi:hypothetical protein